jgi:hypothetical protein
VEVVGIQRIQGIAVRVIIFWFKAISVRTELLRPERVFVIGGINGERRNMAEVICGDCGSKADDVVCRSCYDGKVKDIDNLEDVISTSNEEIKRLNEEVSLLEDKVSELERKNDTP